MTTIAFSFLLDSNPCFKLINVQAFSFASSMVWGTILVNLAKKFELLNNPLLKASIYMELSKLEISIFFLKPRDELLDGIITSFCDEKEVMRLLSHQFVSCIIHDKHLCKPNKWHNGTWWQAIESFLCTSIQGSIKEFARHGTPSISRNTYKFHGCIEVYHVCNKILSYLYNPNI